MYLWSQGLQEGGNSWCCAEPVSPWPGGSKPSYVKNTDQFAGSEKLEPTVGREQKRLRNTCRSWDQSAPSSVCQKGRHHRHLHPPLHRFRLNHTERCCLTGAERAERETTIRTAPWRNTSLQGRVLLWPQNNPTCSALVEWTSPCRWVCLWEQEVGWPGFPSLGDQGQASACWTYVCIDPHPLLAELPGAEKLV